MLEHHHFGYRICKTRRIGEGGFGYVDEVELYNLHGIKCKGKYARKTFSPSARISQSKLDLAQVKDRFKEEVLCQASCVSSNVVSIYLHDLKVENPWFIMEFADSDLSNLIHRNELNLQQKIEALKMIINGIKYIHDQNLLHRDIKPQNILMFHNGVFKLSDFGLVKDLNRESPLTAIASINMGTEGYKAPEVMSAGIYNHKTDIYALGVVIEQFIGAPLNDIISKCTERSANLRYQSANELLDDINRKYPEVKKNV